MNLTLTLTPTLRTDKIFNRDQESVRLQVQQHFTYDVCVLTLVKGMTAAVNQPIPLDAWRGRARGFVHLRTAIIPYIIWEYRFLHVFVGEWKSLWLGHMKVKWEHPSRAMQNTTWDVNLCPKHYTSRTPSKEATPGGRQAERQRTVSEGGKETGRIG